MSADTSVSLTPDQLSKVLKVLERIDEGKAAPQLRDRIGKYFREYAAGRSVINSVLAGAGVRERADSAISGTGVGPAQFHPLSEIRLAAHGFPRGESAEGLAFSEELGATVNLTMWLKAQSAMSAYNLLKEHGSICLNGDYRWTPPGRVTTGESVPSPGGEGVRWSTARCLKAVADDIDRPVHALEYVLDYQVGPPSLKFFRCICALRRDDGWEVLPVFEAPQPLAVARVLPRAAKALQNVSLAALLVFREPWDATWTVVDGIAINANEASLHAHTWADMRAELQGTAAVLDADKHILRNLRSAGVRPSTDDIVVRAPALTQVGRRILRRIRGYKERSAR